MFASLPPAETSDQPITSSNSSNQESIPLIIINVRLPYTDKQLSSKLWRIECLNGRVHKVAPEREEVLAHSDSGHQIDMGGSLMLPALCHSHIHLDKCFILDRCSVISGDFTEALRVTGKAKEGFTLDLADLYTRGARVIRESVECGVTSMRAHVEVDKIVKFSCLDIAQTLQKHCQRICSVQIAVFAQEPLFDNAEDNQPGANYAFLHEAIRRERITVVGSAPYVERTIAQARLNIALVMSLAQDHNAHVDFHLDYNLDPTSEPLIYEVIAQANNQQEFWSRRGTDGRTLRRITIGHATRLQLFTAEEWSNLVETIRDLPITFVGLPQSDMYMQGRGDHGKPLGAPRSTLRVPWLLNEYGIEVAMSVNNVQNAFTPQGSLDPLTLCSQGVALFQSAAPRDIETLVRAVTSTSKLALGHDQGGTREGRESLIPIPGDPADFVVLHGAKMLQDAVLNPPFERTTIHEGKIVARRRADTWVLPIANGRWRREEDHPNLGDVERLMLD